MTATKTEVIELVRRFGQERYRHGKAVIRAEKSANGKAKHRNQIKAKHHADTAADLKRQIESAVTDGPYL